MQLSGFFFPTKLWNYHYCLIPAIPKEFSSLPKRNPKPVSSHFLFFPHLSLCRPWIYFLSWSIPPISAFHLRRILQLLCLASLTPHNVFKVHPCHSVYPDFMPFYDWINICGHFDCFHFLVLKNNVANNICVKVSAWHMFAILLHEFPSEWKLWVIG